MTSNSTQTIRHPLLNTFFSRYFIWFASIALTVFILLFFFQSDNPYKYYQHRSLLTIGAITSVLSLIGLYDIRQKRHAVLRNYPIMGHFRYLFEYFRPEIRQYFIEDDQQELPFSRVQRKMVYQRAKNESSDKPFGSIVDMYASKYRFISHSLAPAEQVDIKNLRVSIGNFQCSQPYSASLFNISAMSFGSLSANAILALNSGAAMGGFYHDTGEGGISPYHKKYGGDLVWEIGSGYFGCRDELGQFNPETFKKQAQLDQVKMIEIKLSQGAKPGHGGVLPKQKISAEIAAVRHVPRDKDCVSPASHSAFSTPLEMMAFIQQLRDLSGGKPVGFKLCIGQPWQFMAIVKAMLQTKIYPDFIVVDGSEGGTGAAPIEFSDHIGAPLIESLVFVHNVLLGADLKQHIRLAATGKIISAFDTVCMFAFGADWVNSARGFMFSLGCIQAQSCHSNQCPTGIATQDKKRQSALDVESKAQRVCNFQQNTLKSLAEMIAAAGLSHPEQIQTHHLVERQDQHRIKTFNQVYPSIKTGALVNSTLEPNHFYARMWRIANPEYF